MKNTLYLCGDYLERGIENKEMMYEMMRLSTLPNTIMLEGNHERHIANFAFNTNFRSFQTIYERSSGTYRKRY